MTLCIAVIGTSNQSCWLAEACKIPSLEGLWMYGVTVYEIVVTAATVPNPDFYTGYTKHVQRLQILWGHLGWFRVCKSDP